MFTDIISDSPIESIPKKLRTRREAEHQEGMHNDRPLGNPYYNGVLGIKGKPYTKIGKK